MKKIVCLLTALLLLLGAFAGCQTNATPSATADSSGAADFSSASEAAAESEELLDSVKIGVVACQSGSMAMDGKFTNYGVELAFDKLQAESNGMINWKGHDVKVEYVFMDDEGKPEVCANVVRRLIEDEGVSAIVGPPMSGCLLSAGPICQEACIPIMGTMATNAKCTQIGDYVFRCCFIDDFQTEVATKYFLENMGVTKVAVLTDNTIDYSVGMTNAFIANFEAAGGTIVEKQDYAGAETKDFNVQLTKIKAANPEAIFMPIYYSEVPLVLEQALAMGITCPILGSDSWDTPDVITYSSAESRANAKYISCFSLFNDDPLCQQFISDFRAKYGEDPNAIAAFTYDSVLLMFNAIENAETLDGPGIRDALANTIGFVGVTGTTSFGDTRDPAKSALIMKFDAGGNLAFDSKIDPS